MGNRNKKVVRIPQGHGMMDQAVKDIMEVSEEVVNQLEVKRGMMQSVLDTVETGFRSEGLHVALRLTEDGYEFLFSDMQDYLANDDDDEDDDDEFDLGDIGQLPIEMFSGEDDDGNPYSIMVILAENEEDEDAFDMNIAVIREMDGQPQILTDHRWEDLEQDF